MAKVNRRKDGSWQSRRSAESRQIDEAYHAWIKRRKAEGKSAPSAPRRAPWRSGDTYHMHSPPSGPGYKRLMDAEDYGGLSDDEPYR